MDRKNMYQILKIGATKYKLLEQNLKQNQKFQKRIKFNQEKEEKKEILKCKENKKYKFQKQIKNKRKDSTIRRMIDHSVKSRFLKNNLIKRTLSSEKQWKVFKKKMESIYLFTKDNVLNQKPIKKSI